MDGGVLDVAQLGPGWRRTQSENEVRARTQAVSLPNHLVLCRVLGRYKFYVNANDVGFGAHIILDGFWEFWITQFIIRNIARDTVVMDIGANHGYYTVLMGDLVGPGGKVICMEPFPTTRQLLTRNVSVNGFAGRTVIEGRAVADVSGRRMAMVCPPTEPKNARILWNAASDAGDAEVETLALDDLDATGVDFIKVDVEGAEERMWVGMQGFLDRNPAVRLLMEFNRGRYERPARMLGEIATRFALRHVDAQSHAVPTTIDQIISAPPGNWMLYLSARDPVPDPPPPPAEEKLLPAESKSPGLAEAALKALGLRR